MDRELHKIADYFEGLALERDMRCGIEAEGVANCASADLFRRAVGKSCRQCHSFMAGKVQRSGCGQGSAWR